MAGKFVQLDISGAKKLQKRLKGISDDTAGKVMLTAVREGAKLVQDAAVRNAERIADTGALARSMKGKRGRVVKKFKQSDGSFSIVAVVGPQIEYSEPAPATGRRATKTGQIVPNNYVHLIEFGTKRTRPKPLLRDATQRTRKAFIRTIEKQGAKRLAKIGQRSLR